MPRSRDRVEIGTRGGQGRSGRRRIGRNRRKAGPFLYVYAALQAVLEAVAGEVAEGLAELVREGRKPAPEGIFLSVWAQQPGFQGETGTELVKLFWPHDLQLATRRA